MEQLTRHQIILLAFLVSFVSSIATGIVVVSLMDQSIQPVTQTINRVVERTIERVASATTTGSARVETVVVTEDDAVVGAIEKAAKSLVRIYTVRPGGEREFRAIGAIATSGGRIVARFAPDGFYTYRGSFAGGNELSLILLSTEPATGISVFQAENGQGLSARAFAPATFADSQKLKLGQKVIAIGGETDLVETSIISSLSYFGEMSPATGERKVGGVRTTIENETLRVQSLLSNLSGHIIGIKDAKDDGAYISGNILNAFIGETR